MDIISYLLILIETRKAVGITGLGTLYKKKIPGRYDAKSHSFLPPSYELTFTAVLKEQEELVNYICEQRNLTSESATYYINEFVENIQAQLADQQKADLSPIGELSIVNDELVLTPSPSINIGADFYGLPVVAAQAETNLATTATALAGSESDLTPVAPETPAEESHVSKQVENENVSPESNETERIVVENPIPTSNEPQSTIPDWAVNYEDDDDDDERRPRRGLRIFLKTLLVLFLIAAAGAITYFIAPNLLTQTKYNYEVTENVVDPYLDIDTTKMDTAATHIVDTIAVAAATKAPIITDTVTVYEVIESAMKSHKKVDEIITNMARRGIKAKKIEPIAGRLIKISVGTFTDYNLAKKHQDSLRAKLKNPDIYIQTIKPKN